MTKSKKNKKDQDFQKPKLQVGKAKPKASNFTNTSFQSKSISVLQKNLDQAAQTPAKLFAQHLSLCNHKSPSQRAESLAHLTTILEAGSPPQPLAEFLPKVGPLLLDASAAVRLKVLRLFRALPLQDVQQAALNILFYIRAGIMALAASVQMSALEAMEWLLDRAGLQVVSTGEGWAGTLVIFKALMKWESETSDGPERKEVTGQRGWTETSSVMAGQTAAQVSVVAKALRVLSSFLTVGLTQIRDLAAIQAEHARHSFPYTHFIQLMMSDNLDDRASFFLKNSARILNVGAVEYIDTAQRQHVFESAMWKPLQGYLRRARDEGGSVGREASSCMDAVKECRKTYQVVNMYGNLMSKLRDIGFERLQRQTEDRVAEGASVEDVMAVDDQEIGGEEQWNNMGMRWREMVPTMSV